ncbi:MAG: DUF2853 family protein [Novosphingobium sp.]
MATDWAADVKKYAKNADDAIITGIVRYCGIALTKVDSSLVAFSDPKELDRVRNNFLKKKLGRTETDDVLNAAIAKVGETMKADRTKNRVTVYYLLADHYKSLPLFAPKAKAKAAATKAPAREAAPKAVAAKTAKPAAKSAGKAAAAVSGAAAVAAASKKPAAKKAAAPAKAPAAKAAAPAKAPAAKAAPAKKAAAPAKKAAAPATKKAPAVKAAAATAAAGGALGLASAAAATAKPVAAPSPAPAPVEPAKVAAAAVAAGSAAVTTAATAAPKAAAPVASAMPGAARDEDSGLGWLWWLLGLAALLFLAWYFFLRGPTEAPVAATETTAAADGGIVVGDGMASAAAVDLTAAPAEGTVTIPTGAGVTVENRDAKPVVKVYFDSGKIDVAPAFDPAAGGLKSWLDAHQGSTLAISGYADPSGNAKLNADLAKKRAQAVQAALVKAGVPEASALLVKPDSVTDATVAKDAARRVEVVVK